MAGSWSNSTQNLIVLVEEVSGYSGIFGYSPAPGAGTLVFSLAAAAGTDPYGNTYPNGLSIGSNTTRQIILNYDGSQSAIGFHAHDGVVGVAASVLEHIFNAGLANEYASLQIIGPAMSGATDYVTLQANSQNNDGSSNANFVFSHGAGGILLTLDRALLTANVPMQVNGNLSLTGDVTVSGQTWQTPTLGTGWAIGPSGGTVQPVQYRQDAEDNLIITGAVHSTSTTPAATIFTLPLAYRPKTTQRSPGVSNAAGTATARYVEVNSNGNVSINANLTTTSTDVYFQVCAPLGNIT